MQAAGRGLPDGSPNVTFLRRIQFEQGTAISLLACAQARSWRDGATTLSIALEFEAAAFEHQTSAKSGEHTPSAHLCRCSEGEAFVASCFVHVSPAAQHPPPHRSCPSLEMTSLHASGSIEEVRRAEENTCRMRVGRNYALQSSPTTSASAPERPDLPHLANGDIVVGLYRRNQREDVGGWHGKLRGQRLI